MGTAFLRDAWLGLFSHWAAWLHPCGEQPEHPGMNRAGMRQRWGASILVTVSPAPPPVLAGAGSPASRDALPWHGPAWKVCRAPPELVLLPARVSLTFIKAKSTLTF